MYHLIDLQKKALLHFLSWEIPSKRSVSEPHTNRKYSTQDSGLEIPDDNDGDSRSGVNRSTTLGEVFENIDEDTDSSSLSLASHEEENSNNRPVIWGPFHGTHNVVLNNPTFRIIHRRVADSDDLSDARLHTDPIEGERDPFRRAHNFVLNDPVIQCIHYMTDNDHAGVAQSEADPVEKESQSSFYRAHHFIANNLLIQHVHRSSVRQSQMHDPVPIWAPFYKARNVLLKSPILRVIDDMGTSQTGVTRERRPSFTGALSCAPFYGAHNIYFDDCVAVDRPGHIPPALGCAGCNFFGETSDFHVHFRSLSDTADLSLLHPHLLAGIELDSKSRRPLPRCHPGTREALRGEITTWLLDKDRQRDMLWLFGPAGVGKSAVAQVIGEYAAERGLLGGAVFLSRTKNLDDPTRLIISISYQLAFHQLAVGNLPYEWLVVEALLRDPMITWKDSRVQFKKLIVEPFSTLRPRGHMEKLLIVIDGLDECRGGTRQLDFVRLVIENLKSPTPLPLLWMICSRPEQHFKDLFTDGSLLDLCWERDLLLNESGAQEDVELYLRSELERIRKKYYNRPGSRRTWSVAANTLKRLVKASAGLFVYASTILRFIGDPDVADPASQLEIILRFLDGPSDVIGSSNPLGPIDTIYLGVFGEVETDHLPTSLDLLGSCAVYPPIPALHLVNLLGVDSESFYLSLRKLHSVLAVPHPGKAHKEPLHFYHASFPDFLLHPTRSKEYWQDPDLCRSWLIGASFHALSDTSIAYSKSLSWCPSTSDEEEEAESPPALSISHEILSLVATHTWEVLTQVSNPTLELLRDTVVNFDFSRLQSICEVIPVDQFISFLRWLYALRNSGQELVDFVRTNPCSDIDEKFVEKCGPLAQPLNLESHNNTDRLEEAPRYVLVGFESKTVIVLVVPEAVMIYSADDIQKL